MSLTLRDRIAGTVLGSALGDALGMPVEGLSHINVRTYYKGIKEMRADEKRRDLQAGQFTADTQRARALTRALTVAPPDSPEAARAAFVARQPMGRLGRAEEIAAMAVHLGSDESVFTTGIDLFVDGGMSI